jgi:N6-L-threonylcarbamoyladenine synthase
MLFGLENHEGQSNTMTDTLTLLGIESSCDDTAAAVVRRVNDQAEVLSSIVVGQEDLHAAFGGVVPEIAARAHAEQLDIAVERALQESGVSLEGIDAIAVTAGPGLIGGVVSGVMCAKGLAAGTGKPLVGVNHLAGHALTPRMTHGLNFPYLMLLVSGGHCQFLAVLSETEFRRIGGTIDDAPGEAFDKTARLLGLGYPGGPLVEQAAKNGDQNRFKFPRPLLDRSDCNMSFSGLKTALRRARDQLIKKQGGITERDRNDLCASFELAVADTLAEKTRRALIVFQEMTDGKSFAVAGGVAANKLIGQKLRSITEAQEVSFTSPPLKYCTDNAAMIAWAGLEQFSNGASDDMTLAARPRWPLDQTAQPMLGSGKKGAKA